MVTERFVRIKDLADKFPVKRGTLYNWRHQGKYPELFRKIGRCLCVDMETFNRMMESNSTR